VFAECPAGGLACGNQRRCTGSGSTLEVLSGDALYKYTFTFTLFCFLCYALQISLLIVTCYVVFFMQWWIWLRSARVIGSWVCSYVWNAYLYAPCSIKKTGHLELIRQLQFKIFPNYFWAQRDLIQSSCFTLAQNQLCGYHNNFSYLTHLKQQRSVSEKTGPLRFLISRIGLNHEWH